MKCVTCKTNPAVVDATYGILDCLPCRDRIQTQRFMPTEIIPDRIKVDRKSGAKDTIQMYRKGELSKEFIDTYGTSRIKATKQEIKNAKNVWLRDTGAYYK